MLFMRHMPTTEIPSYEHHIYSELQSDITQKIRKVNAGDDGWLQAQVKLASTHGHPATRQGTIDHESENSPVLPVVLCDQ